MFNQKVSLIIKGVLVVTAILLCVFSSDPTSASASVSSSISPEPASSASMSIKPNTSFVGINWEPSTKVTTVKPIWSVSMDIPTLDYQMSQGVIDTGAGLAYYLQKGILQAIDVKTGKQAWSFGNGLSSPLLYDSGRVYVGSTSGTLFAVNAITGKKLWATSSIYKNMEQLAVNGNQLFALNGDILSFNATDGKLQWKDNYEWSIPGPIVISGDRLVVRNEESGAYTHSNLLGFDSKTGKNIWVISSYNFPLEIKAGIILAQPELTLFTMTRLPTLDSIDLQTGKLLKSTVYNPENLDLTKPDLFNQGIISITDEHVYINMGPKVYGYPSNQTEPDNTKKDTFALNKNGVRFVAGPYDGRFLFTDSLGIYGVKTANKSLIEYLEGLTNPIARFDLIGHGIYAAQTDGRVVAIDLVTAKPVLELQTYGRVFGPTLSESGIILIQTKGKLLGIKEPEVLKVK